MCQSLAKGLASRCFWAATTLYTITRKSEYLEHACRFAAYLVGLQQDYGTFLYPELWKSYPPEKWELIPNASGQFTLWITRTLGAFETG